MKPFKLLLVALVLTVGLSSCSSIKVTSDYDDETDFDDFKTYAFYKPGIDEAEISDLDKRRILRAIDKELNEKGLEKSKEPDLLISIFADATENVNVYENYYGWYDPFYWGYNPRYTRSYSTTQGTLTIDLIDAENKVLLWQGVGTGDLVSTEEKVDKRVERINEIVQEILDRYPPGAKK